ncbi:MAG: DUF1802 family protein [Planctomycetota bacterium]|nr:DUF1802 family protein [Planctomycetota bacterium]
MNSPAHLDVALKEWQTVCAALESGRQIILLRKGGISETEGKFEIEHGQFLLFPTFLHQNVEMLKSSEHAVFQPASAEPAELTISAWASITDIIKMPSRSVMDRLDAQHIWSSPLIDMRFNYRPDRPLYLLLIRAFRLHQPIKIANTPDYAGCKSWVPLDQPIATGDALPVLDDVKFEVLRQRVINLIAAPKPA